MAPASDGVLVPVRSASGDTSGVKPAFVVRRREQVVVPTLPIVCLHVVRLILGPVDGIPRPLRRLLVHYDDRP